MNNTAIDDWEKFFLGLFSAIPVDKMPATAGDKSISSGNWEIPVLVFGNRAVHAVPLLEPIHWTDDIAETKKDIRSH
jgi:hypothetical protein